MQVSVSGAMSLGGKWQPSNPYKYAAYNTGVTLPAGASYMAKPYEGALSPVTASAAVTVAPTWGTGLVLLAVLAVLVFWRGGCPCGS